MKLIAFLSLITLSYAQVLSIKVDNMGCPNCAKKIIAASEKVAKVKDFKADYKSKDLQIDFKEQADAQAVIDEINKIGYKAHL